MLNFGNKEFRNLQEQVLQNARDIATLKGIENLKIVIVEELPEEGNPNYIYLVPNEDGEESNVYNEYIWLADEEAYEQIGAVNIDLTNYVTTDTDQTLTGLKSIKSKLNFVSPNGNNAWWLSINDTSQFFIGLGENNNKVRFDTTDTLLDTNFLPWTTNAKDLGSATKSWKDLYLSGKASFTAGTNTFTIGGNAYNGLDIQRQGVTVMSFGGSDFSTYNHNPITNNTYNLGSSARCWKDAYIVGNLSDGTHSVTVANIASKATTTFMSGTFDSNGESTIDTEQTGTPEGLFIFTYGNCQCLMRLTATMVQNADVTPINVSCPMIYNSATVNGWLSITKSGTILVLTITDGTNHVDSGYAWTLVKTNLI